MAAKARRNYPVSGTTAYDIYSPQYSGNIAQPLPEEPAPKPKAKSSSKKRKKAKARAKTAVAPFGVVGTAVVAILLFMVVYGYVQLYEATSRVGELNDQLAELQEENADLQSTYENGIDLSKIESQAKGLGMRQPTASQKVYLNIPVEDKAEVIVSEEHSLPGTVWAAIRDSFKGLIEYFSQ